eukprot:12264873-Alexandrium_andersonii.AAC.1
MLLGAVAGTSGRCRAKTERARKCPKATENTPQLTENVPAFSGSSGTARDSPRKHETVVAGRAGPSEKR